MTTAHAELGTTSVYGPDSQQEIDLAVVRRIVAHVIEAGHWDLPPVLVVEDIGNGAQMLDGHHRRMAAQIISEIPSLQIDLRDGIPAWIVECDAMQAVLDDIFGGDMPERLADLDDYIMLSDGSHYAGR